jgi:hypothetical protein
MDFRPGQHRRRRIERRDHTYISASKPGHLRLTVSTPLYSTIMLIVCSLRLMGRLAGIFRDFCDTFRSTRSLSSRYKCVKDCDEQLNHLFDDTPDLRPIPDETFSSAFDLTQPYDFRPWSRYLWATTIPPVRIQLWRWFLGRSYTDSRYSEARTVCLNAARDTITMRFKAVPLMYLKNWHVSSYTVMCGMVFGIEMLHGKVDEDTRTGLCDELRQVLALLEDTDNPNSMVTRGIEILGKMLDDARPPAGTRSTGQPHPDDISGIQLDPGLDPSAAVETGSWQMSPGLRTDQWDHDLFDMLLNSDSWANGAGDGLANFSQFGT